MVIPAPVTMEKGKVIKLGQDNPDFKSLIWVARAVSTDETRYYSIGGIRIEAGFAVATDGHRLHCARLQEEYEEGLYHVFKKGNKVLLLMRFEEAQGNAYPKWSKIVPDHTEKGTLLPFLNHSATNSYALLVRTGRTVHYEYHQDVMGKGRPCDEFNCFVPREVGAVHYWNSERMALVMPIREQ